MRDVTRFASCREFYIHKFRSMINKTDKNGELLPDDKRLTQFGRTLRKFSVDELPALISIFTGKMSIIGPRSLLPQPLDRYTPRHRMRLSVKTGLALVAIKALETWSWNDQFGNDIFNFLEYQFFPRC